MEQITRNDLFALLLAESGKSATTVGIHTVTTLEPNKGSTVKSRVTSVPFIDQFGTACILKWKEQTVQINVIYENSVNNKKEKDGQERDFKSKGMNYGEFIPGSRILIQKGEKEDTKYYVRVYLTNSNLGEKIKYTKANGKELTPKELKIFKSEFESVKAEKVKSQGLDYEDASKPVNYSINSIRQINMYGKSYQIVD
jgi:hypothetical protein